MTTIQIQMRNEWGARPPKSTLALNWSKVDKFIVHYSGAKRTQTVRSIQNYCMDNKGHSDIDYNELVRGNVLYIGRGNNVGSHTLGNNSSSYGICVIGLDGDATNDDFNVIRSRYDWACKQAGRTLQKLGHNQAPGLPVNYTDCPGSEIQTWINQGMPYMSEDNMPDYGPIGPPTTISELNATYPDTMLADIFAALVIGDTGWGTANGHGADAWTLYKRLAEIKAAIGTVTLTDAQLDTLATKIAAKMATPAQIADAVVDEEAARLAA